MKFLASAATLLVLASPSFAGDVITFEVTETEEFGRYLTVDDGRPVYVFSTDTRASDDEQALISCTSTDCLEAWPLVTTSTDPQAGDGVDASLLDTVEHDGQMIVTYHGLPLYYFAKDEDTKPPMGNDVESFGGEWSLLDPAASMAGDVAVGEKMYANSCAQCHGRTGRGLASFPSIAGNDADYITSRLMQYRAGEAIGPNSALMFPVAAELSDEDIANLAAFISAEFE